MEDRILHLIETEVKTPKAFEELISKMNQVIRRLEEQKQNITH